MTIDSLAELPLYKHHLTPGRRRTLDDYHDADPGRI